MTEKKMIAMAEKAFQEASLVGKALKDVVFYGDDPFLNKNRMLSLYDNHIAPYPTYARKVRAADIPDDLKIGIGRATFETRFALVFSDDTAILFFLNGGKTEVRYIPKGELKRQERENNINEHMLYAPVFGRTVKEYKIICHIPNRKRELWFDISFREGLILRITDTGMYILEEKNRPMLITVGELRKMIPNYKSFFDDELEIWESDTKVAQVYLGKRENDNSLSVRLIRKLLEICDDPMQVELIMYHLKTKEEGQKMLDLAEAGGEKASIKNLIHTAIGMDDER